MSSETLEERVWLRRLSKCDRRELRRLRSDPPMLHLPGAAIEQRHLRIGAFDRLQLSGSAAERAATLSLCSIAPSEEQEQDDE